MEKNTKIIFSAFAVILICFVMFNTSLTGAWSLAFWRRPSRDDVTCPEAKPIGEPYCSPNQRQVMQKYLSYRKVHKGATSYKCEPMPSEKVIQTCKEGCKAGGCIKTEITCVDSDGLSLDIRGTTKGIAWGTSDYVTKTDYCHTEGAKAGLLAEFYCANNMVASISYNCPLHHVCKVGACVKGEEILCDYDDICEIGEEAETCGDCDFAPGWSCDHDGICESGEPVRECDDCPVKSITYKDGDAYIGYSPTDPLWIWDLEGLTSKAVTIITSKENLLEKSGIILGIQNYDIRNDDTDNPAGIGECYAYPNDYAQICLDSLTVADDDYLTVTVKQSDNVALDYVYPSDKALSSTEDIVKIYGPKADSFKLNNGLFTNEVFIASVDGGFNVYYKNEGQNPSIRYLDHFDHAYIVGTMNYGNNEGIEITLSYSPNAGKLFVIYKISNKGELPETNEKITAGFRVVSNKIESLGSVPSSAEKEELYWQPTMSALPVYLGTKDEDHRITYGIIIRDPRANGGSDKAVLQIPKEQVQANIVVKGTSTIVGGGNGGTLTVTGGVTEDIPLGKAIAETTTWALDWELDDSDISSFQDTTINLGGNNIDVHDAIILSKKSPTVATSLTSSDDDYESNVFLEKFRRSTNYYYFFDDIADLTKVSESNPLIINLLGKKIKIIGVTDNSITIQQ